MHSELKPLLNNNNISFHGQHFSYMDFTLIRGLRRCVQSPVTAAFANIALQCIVIGKTLWQEVESLCDPSLSLAFAYGLLVNIILELTIGILVGILLNSRQTIWNTARNHPTEQSRTVVYGAIVYSWIGPLVGVGLQDWRTKACLAARAQ